jgi:hypothetical protein
MTSGSEDQPKRRGRAFLVFGAAGIVLAVSYLVFCLVSGRFESTGDPSGDFAAISGPVASIVGLTFGSIALLGIGIALRRAAQPPHDRSGVPRS